MGLVLPDTLVNDIELGRVSLFLGAGANFGSTRNTGEDIPQTPLLIDLISKRFQVAFEAEDTLPDVAGYLSTTGRGEEFSLFLKSVFSGCHPSEAMSSIFKHYWPHVYTTNIDDVVTSALEKNSRNYKTFVLRDSIVEFSIADRYSQVVYLHGHCDRIKDGIVFSKRDYINTQIDITPWYDQLANDLFLHKFIFIGTRLDEPVFDYVLEMKKRDFGVSGVNGYIILPTLSATKAAVLAANGIVHVPGTTAEFSDWLASRFPQSVEPDAILERKYPELFSLRASASSDVFGALSKLKDLTVVSEVKRSGRAAPATQVRDFYRGIKPTWDEILDGVPATLGHYSRLQTAIDDLVAGKNRALIVLGPAGSGKTTAIRLAALSLARNSGVQTLVLDSSFPEFDSTIKALSELSKNNAVVFFDGADSVSRDLADIIESRKYEHIKFVLTERRNIWNERTSSVIRNEYSFFSIDRISREDAAAIRDKLEQFGPFSKLSKLNRSDQIVRIYDRSQRQLLMGMLEATSEKGFENIIRSDFRGVENEELRFLIVVVALATIHRMGLPTTLAFAAFASRFGFFPKIGHFNSLAGILIHNGSELIVRHALYSQVLLEQIVNPDLVKDALEALLLSFAKYGTPVPVRARALAPLFIRLVRHRFVNAVLHNKRDAVIGLYERIEKAFSADGHFYLQYGLAHRAFGEDEEALSKIKASVDIYRSFNAQHALAKQKIIMACKMNSQILAEPLFDEAKNELESLDRSDKNPGLYPLITLAEGSLDYASVFLGRDQASALAERFSAQVAARLAKDPGNERLKKCRDKINLFKKAGTITTFEADDVV